MQNFSGQIYSNVKHKISSCNRCSIQCFTMQLDVTQSQAGFAACSNSRTGSRSRLFPFSKLASSYSMAPIWTKQSSRRLSSCQDARIVSGWSHPVFNRLCSPLPQFAIQSPRLSISCNNLWRAWRPSELFFCGRRWGGRRRRRDWDQTRSCTSSWGKCSQPTTSGLS